MSWDLIMSLQLPLPSLRCLCKGRAVYICDYSQPRCSVMYHYHCGVFPVRGMEITEDWSPAEHKEQLIWTKWAQSLLCLAALLADPPSCLWWLREEVPWDCVGDGDARVEMLGCSWRCRMVVWGHQHPKSQTSSLEQTGNERHLVWLPFMLCK